MKSSEELHTVGGRSGSLVPHPSASRSETPSEEDYDEFSQRLDSGQDDLVVGVDNADIQEILRRGSQRAKDATSGPAAAKKQGRFRELVFTRKFSAFDRQNEAAANSPFHGFFTLFWMAVFFSMVKLAWTNWSVHGNPLGSNEILSTMFRRDIVVLLVSDVVMCGLSTVSWILQRLILVGYLDWDRSGWIIQNIWQTLFIAGVVGWTMVRDWPWTHTVFFVLHGIVMLMKQHSYAFYNGYLSSIYRSRADLRAKLERLARMSPVQSPSSTEPSASAVSTSHLAHPPSAHQMKERRSSVTHTASSLSSAAAAVAGASIRTQQQQQRQQEADDIDKIAEAIKHQKPLDADQIQVFERVLRWEVEALTADLKGKSTRPENVYPRNLTLMNQYEYNFLPTLVYELEYPRSDKIRWDYVAEKMAGTFGIIFVMLMVSQSFIYPVVMKTVEMKEIGTPLSERFQAFPWMLGELIFPFMLEYLLVWYLIWETILNWLAELTYFADRSFYDAWWNSVSWDQFARDWNRPVHNFLLRHVYHSSISAMKVNKHTATVITFLLSACVHELVMWCIFKKLRGYLLLSQMCQLPLVKLSRTKWLRGKETLGNMIFWVGIFTGPSILCSLYLIL